MSITRRLTPWALFMAAAALAAPHRFDRQAQQPIPVTGMNTGIDNRTGERPSRWEINALEHEGGPRWDLYIQGLAALQNKTETDERSHFSIAGEIIHQPSRPSWFSSILIQHLVGIHGMPYVPYNGVGPAPGGSGGGFCPHGEAQFVAWHRPYLALYEQILGSEIQRIAARYNASHRNSSAYREAARAFRLPYWDWASNAQLPPSCAAPNVTVAGPRGPLTMRNPLYSYKWPTYPLNQTQFPGSVGWPDETTRASDGKSDFSVDVVNANLAAVAGQLKDQVYRTFAYAETYDQMSSMADPAGVSLEAAHNIVHNAVGGSFASIDVTAFDGLFMLHHANLDRLAALWQAIHPNDTYQSRSYASGGLYGTARGENMTAESPVKPFYRADGKSFHTGISASSIEAFGYTYPELRGWDSGQRNQGSSDLVSRINALYGSGSGGGDFGEASLAGDEWFVEIAVNRSELELPCNIDIHVGETFAGRVALLGMPMHGLAYAEIPLQRALKSLGLNRTGSNAVERVLREQLRVEIIKGSGVTFDAKDTTGLVVNIAVTHIVSHGSDFELTKYGHERVASLGDWSGTG
ncbi:Di-copper centre-containing protein [Annulohypoxylon truncatum]|uniref:Di-copper centre-containing protein n=1 Tax=Annulohypoxylon truncatum TaxID=327061 RepID=UPI002007647B|nr:Di-copper centre-containing protein [Annulohypoxylon truncatum]KAI1211298.1 Di-copper centre-containing protein [Annulohypoxylon truncatum]